MQYRSNQHIESGFIKNSGSGTLVSGVKTFSVKYRKELNLLKVTGNGLAKETWARLEEALTYVDLHFINSSELKIYFRIETISGTGVKYLFLLIKKLNQLFEEAKKVKVFWSCQSEYETEILDLGCDLQQFCKFPFEVSYL